MKDFIFFGLVVPRKNAFLSLSQDRKFKLCNFVQLQMCISTAGNFSLGHCHGFLLIVSTNCPAISMAQFRQTTKRLRKSITKSQPPCSQTHSRRKASAACLVMIIFSLKMTVNAARLHRYLRFLLYSEFYFSCRRRKRGLFFLCWGDEIVKPFLTSQ